MSPADHDSCQVTLEVALGSRSYPIHIGPGLLAQADRLLGRELDGRRVFIIADEALAETHLPALQTALARSNASRQHCLPIAGGEEAKSFARLEYLAETMLGLGMDRQSLVVAAGGGVIGDLAGFAAATLLRGVSFIQIPTTLLAQTDSAVGGKTGINTSKGKNLVGAFHQPSAVLADTASLKTLPLRELRAGYAEVVKYALLGDAGFFTWLEQHGENLFSHDPAIVTEVIRRCCQAKAAIVAEDEQEKGRRALLNLGHTFGHAFEAVAGYDGSVLHGEAVAVGMVHAFRLAVRLGMTKAAERDKVIAHLQRHGLPTRRADLGNRVAAADSSTLLEHMMRDKKARANQLVLILPVAIGKAVVTQAVQPDSVRAILEEETI